MADLLQADAEGGAERVHRPEDALVVFGHRREPGPERRELPRQPHPLPQTVAEGVGRVLLPSDFAARAGHSGDSTSPSSNGVLRLQDQVSCQVRNCTRCTLVACGELTRAPSTRTPSFNAAAAGAGGDAQGATRIRRYAGSVTSSSSTARTAAPTSVGHCATAHDRHNPA